MIRKVFEVDPLLCSRYGGQMRIIAFLTDYAVVDRIINHFKLTFVEAKPPPSQVVSQQLLMAAEASAAFFPAMSNSLLLLTSLRAEIYSFLRWLDG